MIDFRYHLISLVSVLIALAIGIVLGAGPLKEDIGQSLSNQVVEIRAEKDALRDRLAETEGALSVQEDFADAELDRMVAGRLVQRRVAVITLPGADDSLVTRTEDTLSAAGARLSGPLEVNAAWTATDEQGRAERAALAAQLATTLGIPLPEDTSSPLDQVLAALIATRAAGEGAAPASEPSAQDRLAAWAALQSAGLVDGTLPGERSTMVVVITPPPVASESTASGAGEALTRLAQLINRIDEAADGSVVVAQIDQPDAAGSSIVSATRGTSAVRQNVSTIDNAASAIGQAGTVAALLEQARGGAGQYGFAPGAQSPFPSVS